MLIAMKTIMSLLRSNLLLIYVLIFAFIKYDFLQLVTGEALCDNGWTRYETKCFKFHSDKAYVNFYQAYLLCHEIYNASLVSIHTQREQNFLSNFAFSINHAENHVWIGARRVDNESFEWTDKTKFNYTFWSSGQPNNLENKHYCASMLFTTNAAEIGKWYDDPCTDKYHVICQQKIKFSKTYSVQAIKTSFNETSAGVKKSIAAKRNFKNNAENLKKCNGTQTIILISVSVVQLLIIISLIAFFYGKKRSFLPPYRNFSMTECNESTT